LIDSNFDPYQELIDLRVELEILKANQKTLMNAHNRLNHRLERQLKWQQEQQEDLAELRYYVELFKDSH
jgi:hypothetical protein